MMHEYCVGWGYCGSEKAGKPMHVTQFIPDTGEVNADQFVTWLIRAEQMEGSNDLKTHWASLRKVFIKHMGSYSVDALELHSKWNPVRSTLYEEGE